MTSSLTEEGGNIRTYTMEANRRSVFQTKFGQLFLKKRTLSGRNGADEVEAVLVELTNDHLVVRTKEEGRPLNEDALIKEERHVSLVKNTHGSIGISLEGGIEMKTFVTISDVFWNLPAHSSGQVFKGDVILMVNGTDVTHMTVNEVAHMIAVSRKTVMLHLARPGNEQREPNVLLEDSKLREGLLVKDVLLEQDYNGVGITLKGGIELRTPLRVDRIITNSPAERSGLIDCDDILLAVNHVDTRYKTIGEVMDLVAGCGRYVTLQLGFPANPTAEGDDMNQKVVRVYKGEAPLGISITGSPVSITDVKEGTPAGMCDDIHKGDVIKAVNGTDVSDMNPREVEYLLRSGGSEVELLIQKRQSVPARSGAQSDELLVISSIPLSMAYLTRYQKGTDQLKANAFQIYSSDGSSHIELYGPRSRGEVIEEWIDAIRNNIRILNEREAFRMNEMIGVISKVSWVSWVSERLPSANHCQTWSKKVLVLRSDVLEIYNSPPETVTDWCQPESVLKLAEFSIEILKGRSQPNLRSHSIHVQSGKGQSHILSFECSTDLSICTKALHTNTIGYVLDKKCRQFKGRWNGQDIVLAIDINLGLVFEDAATKKILLQKPFSQLVGSSDDAVVTLKLEFLSNQPGKHEVQTLKLDHLHLVLCCLETFLAVKVAQTDPSFIYSTNLSMVAI